MSTEIDVFEFTRGARSAEGRIALVRLERLASLVSDPVGDLDWRLDGWRERDAVGHERLRLHLRVSGSVVMRCGRCLGPARLPLAVDRGFRLAASEGEAEKWDLDDEESDALVASRKFDTLALVEDEAILALPPVANHAECDRPAAAPGAAPSPRTAEDAPRRPFAELAKLNRKPPP